jgi:abequosyltransferase
MNHNFDISFCIPTYNFGRFIGETLDSIIAQADDRVQIVIVDGGSTDETAQVVAGKTRIFSHIKFVQRQERSGVDRDILETVVQADGKFCWLFSSDDLLAPGALAEVRRQCAEDWDVFLTNFALCDLKMNRLGRHRIVDVAAPETFDWSDPACRQRYFARAETTTAFFSFISALVVRRSSWLCVPQQAQFIGSCWIIAAQLFALARRQLKVRYYPGELLLKRGDNDSFMGAGIVNRIGISVSGFRGLAARYFGADSHEARHVSRVIKNEYTLLAMLMYKVAIDSQRDEVALAKFAALVNQHYADGLALDFVRRSVLRTPASVLRVLIRVYRHLKPARRLARKVLTLVASRLRPAPASFEAAGVGTELSNFADAGADAVQNRAA